MEWNRFWTFVRPCEFVAVGECESSSDYQEIRSTQSCVGHVLASTRSSIPLEMNCAVEDSVARKRTRELRIRTIVCIDITRCRGNCGREMERASAKLSSSASSSKPGKGAFDATRGLGNWKSRVAYVESRVFQIPPSLVLFRKSSFRPAVVSSSSPERNLTFSFLHIFSQLRLTNRFLRFQHPSSC